MFSNTKIKAPITLLLTLSILIFYVPLVNATEDYWTKKTPMQTARSGLGVAAVNDKIYAIGGVISSGFVPSSPGSAVYAGKTSVEVTGVNEEYDPATDTWTYKTAMPTPRAVFATAVYQNKIYCIGGKTSDDYTGVNEAYDPTTNTWETKTSMPTARSWLTANVVNGKIYLMGGYPNETLNEVYDPATDTWTTKTPAPNVLIFGFDKPASAVIDNRIYVIGGISQDQSYDLNQIYDPETDTWRSAAYPITSVDGGAAAATTGILAPKRIYVLGNSANFRQGEEQNFVRVYDPETDNWTFGADVPTKRYNFGVAVVNDILYTIGGHTYSFIPGNYEPLAVNEQYTPIGYIPEFPAWIILPLFLAASLVAVLCKQRLPKTPNHNHIRSLITAYC